MWKRRLVMRNFKRKKKSHRNANANAMWPIHFKSLVRTVVPKKNKGKGREKKKRIANLFSASCCRKKKTPLCNGKNYDLLEGTPKARETQKQQYPRTETLKKGACQTEKKKKQTHTVELKT